MSNKNQSAIAGRVDEVEMVLDLSQLRNVEQHGDSIHFSMEMRILDARPIGEALEEQGFSMVEAERYLGELFEIIQRDQVGKALSKHIKPRW